MLNTNIPYNKYYYHLQIILYKFIKKQFNYQINYFFSKEIMAKLSQESKLGEGFILIRLKSMLGNGIIKRKQYIIYMLLLRFL